MADIHIVFCMERICRCGQKGVILQKGVRAYDHI